MAQEIDHAPAFKWWVKAVMTKRFSIISLFKKRNARYLKKTPKFGIEVPKSNAHEYVLDKNNGNTPWADAIANEMRDMSPAFNNLESGKIVSIGYQRVNYHMIFDVKMEDFRRKVKLVVGGNMTEPPSTIIYLSVVSRETVSIALALASLNELLVKVADIHNAYITEPVTEKILTVPGQEFDEDTGRNSILVQALYGLKSARSSFPNHLEGCMHHL